MANNFLHIDGTRNLIEALCDNRSLRKLNLASNFIKDDGCEQVCYYLGLPTCLLLELNLQDNFITEKSAGCIIDVLDPGTGFPSDQQTLFSSKNQYLTSLDLRNNEIKKESLQKLDVTRPGTTVHLDIKKQRVSEVIDLV